MKSRDNCGNCGNYGTLSCPMRDHLPDIPGKVCPDWVDGEAGEWEELQEYMENELE